MGIRIVCGTCGSTEVVRDAWAAWDEDTQQWVLENVFDEAYCHECEDTRQLAEQPLEP